MNQHSKEKLTFYVLVTALLCLGIIWITLSIVLERTITVCPSKLILNLPCPGCGMTRAINALCHGQIRIAIHYNANCLIMLPAIVFTFFSLLYDIFTGKQFTLNSYKAINTLISNKYFLILFFLLQTYIVYHHLKNGI